ncbi:unnamed protein product [Sphagnum balticum]
MAQENIVQRPELDYLPSFKVFQDRSQRIAANSDAILKRKDFNLPDGYPRFIIGDRVWSALPGNNTIEQVSQETFPLPSLRTKLRSAAEEVHEGKGLVILRGLDPSKHTPMENAILFLGMSSYIAEQQGVQDKFGNMIGNFDCILKTSLSLTLLSIAHIANYPPGQNVIPEDEATSSSAALAGSRYDLDFIPRDPETRPLLYLSPNHGPFFVVSWKKLTGSNEYPLSANLPAMSDEQAEALDLLHFTALKHSISIANKKGDMIFCNNLAMFHARKSFSEQGGSRRRLLRRWLRNEELAWDTSAVLEELWFTVFGMSPRRERAIWKIEPNDFNVDQFLTHKMTCWN